MGINLKFREIFYFLIKLIIIFTIKVIKIFKYLIRRSYVHKVLSVRHRWYISKNGNHYNPTLKATVYKWMGGWNIARFGLHYEGYQSKRRAQEVVFKMWMKERLRKRKL